MDSGMPLRGKGGWSVIQFAFWTKYSGNNSGEREIREWRNCFEGCLSSPILNGKGQT